jgi:hypothetical protein
MQKISSVSEIPAIASYLDRIGAVTRGMKTAVIKEQIGRYWKDICAIRFLEGGEVKCDIAEYAPTEVERAAILAAWPGYSFPKLKSLYHITNPPDMMRNAEPKDIFEFRTDDGEQIIMVQVRIPKGENDKEYIPWTYWDDDKWRSMEPDGNLPLWGADQLKKNKVVFIHEGAKAARYCRWLAEGTDLEARKARAEHPWGNDLVNAAHVGWIGGALNPGRTDWSQLAKEGVERAYIVADNDQPGKHAITSIAKALRMPTFSIEFSDRFKSSFDLADPFPPEMFKKNGGVTFYIGPKMRDLMQPATWATDIAENPTGKGKPITVLRESFSRIWAYVDEIDAFVCTEMPEILRTEAVFNKMVAPFSHVKETSTLLLRNYKGRSARVCYRPDVNARLVDHRGANAINLHVPSSIRSVPGDPAPWIEFLEYMFVNENERKEVERWCATLIARPDVRMGYGLLLISERQGIGKTTLGALILAPLVGHHNVSHPGESDITSSFNEWVAQKRLAIVNEIYSGSSWKAYHSLKSIITDQDVTVNQKYTRQYVIENWCHILACSNSMRALKMEMDDRRWYYPEIIETPWKAEKFMEFRRWVQGGGLSIIRHWADNYGNYVKPAERAPMTERKQEMIEGSRSEAQSAAAALADLLRNREQPSALLLKDVIGWVRSTIQGRMFDSDYELRRAMSENGVRQWGKRIKVHGWLQHAILNDALFDLAQRAEDPLPVIRQHVVKPEELMESEM